MAASPSSFPQVTAQQRLPLLVEHIEAVQMGPKTLGSSKSAIEAFEITLKAILTPEDLKLFLMGLTGTKIVVLTNPTEEGSA